MKTCKLCNSKLPGRIWIEGSWRHLQGRKYCLECSPFGTHNTRSLRKNDEGKTVIINIRKDSNEEVTCTRCNRRYIYDRGKGHTLTLCNSCVANRQRNRVKQKCVEYKGGECQKCGYSKSMRALSFHHRNPEHKEFGLGGKMTWRWSRLMAELDKCDLLCANCHMEEEDVIQASKV